MTLHNRHFWTVCIWAENRSHAVWELKKWGAREREHFCQRNSTYPAINRQWIMSPGENGTYGHPVPNLSGAEAIVSDP